MFCIILFFFFFRERIVYLQFKELNINSYTVCETYRGYAALTGVPLQPLKFKSIYGYKTEVLN